MQVKFKGFPVGGEDGIFSVERSQNVKSEDCIPGNIPYITRTALNNGMAGLCGNIDAVNEGNCITIGGESAVAFYQERDFVTGNNICVLRNQRLNKDNALYIVSCLNKRVGDYSYSHARSRAAIIAENILLPVTTKYVPDFETMSALAGGGIDMSKIDTSSWKEFKISDVFGKAYLGKYHNPQELTPDSDGYPYICASRFNNGINSQMPRVNGQSLALTPEKIIAWGKQCPVFTYHDEPCVTSQGMYYLDMSEYDKNVSLFLCAVLTNTCKNKFSYSKCLIGSIMDDVIIKLPVKESEEIDWEYMQDRIKELEQDRIKELEQYLIVTGLNDYELTEEDKEVLQRFREVAA